jgi:hypothetical protein
MEVVRSYLRGIAGVIRDESKTSFLVPIHALQTSVAVEINWAQLLPYAEGEELRLSLVPPDSTVER